jgi:hypothetical protein
MSFPTLDAISRIYEKSTNTQITIHRITEPIFGNFCVSVDQFDRLLSDLATEEYWRQFMLPLKRIRFGLCAVPFTHQYKTNRIINTLEDLRSHIQLCHKIYPQHTDGALAVLQHLEKVAEESADPLLEKLIELSPTSHSVAWVVKESRLIQDVETLVSSLNLDHVRVIHPLQLKGEDCYDHLIVVGPSRWFPDSVFTAPRSKNIHIVIFDWIKDRWKPQDVFSQPYKSSGPLNRKLISEAQADRSKWERLDPSSLLIVVDKAATIQSALGKQQDDEFDNVEAICAFLEGDWVVFIDAGDGAKTLIIDPDEEPNKRIDRIPAKSVQPGIFILVRSGGGEDYIVPIADRLLGDSAAQARRYQQHWKRLLREHVKQHGLLQTSVDLLDLGSNIANEVNVRNWMSPRSIRTQKFHDFDAIMRLVGLGPQAVEYWEVMDKINSAHRSAGYKVRELLLDQVKDLDINQLHKQGQMEFKLADSDDGGIVAFRVESLLSDLVSVPYSRIGQPFKLDLNVWHE